MDSLKDFILDSWCKLQKYEKSGRYFHSLTPEDNHPIVVHKKTNQLTFVLSGSGIAVIDGKSIKIHKNTTVFIEAGASHQFIATSKQLNLFHIHVPDEGRDNDRYIIEGEDYKRYGE